MNTSLDVCSGLGVWVEPGLLAIIACKKKISPLYRQSPPWIPYSSLDSSFLRLTRSSSFILHAASKSAGICLSVYLALKLSLCRGREYSLTYSIPDRHAYDYLYYIFQFESASDRHPKSPYQCLDGTWCNFGAQFDISRSFRERKVGLGLEMISCDAKIISNLWPLWRRWTLRVKAALHVCLH